MIKQTFIISCWCGAPTYEEARVLRRYYAGARCDFYRVSCKKLSTALKYLKGWRQQAIRDGDFFSRELTGEDAQYIIESTPDGYNTEAIVASGFTKDL